MAQPVLSNRGIGVLPRQVDCFKCTLGLCDGVHAREPLPLPSISQTSVTSNKNSNRIQKENLQLPHRSSLPTVPISTGPVPVGQLPPSMTVTILEHTKVRLGGGFEVQEITTGFESRWVFLSNILSTVSEKTIRRILKPFGQVDDLRMPATPAGASMTIKVLFSTSSEAMQTLSALNGALLFDRRVGARLPVNNTGRGNGTLQDSSVKIEWEIPGKLGFAGYASQAEAEAAVSAANGSTLHETCIGAVIYEGLPTLGAVNVRFIGLPPSAHAEDLNQFGQPEAVMLERPNYSSLAHAVKGVQGLLDDFGQVLGFEVFPGPYKDGIVRGLAHFSSPSVAQTASHHLNGRRPYFIGKGKLVARHVQVLSYTLPIIAYNKLASDITWLRRSFWTRNRGAALFVVDRKAERLQDPSLPVYIKLSSEDVGELGHLKSEFEKLLHGEKIMQSGKVVWDGFFERPAGSAFLHELERNNPGVEIQKLIGRRTITLFGPIWKRQHVRQVILDKIARTRAQQTRIIPLAGRLIALFMSAELMDLQKNLGRENVVLDLVQRTLTIRGNDAAYDAAQRVVNAVPKRQTDDRRDDIVECPVCFNEVVSSIQLRCGHCWCRQCFANYLVAAIDNKIFPLTCLGNEATCSQPVSVNIARDVLTADDFDRVVNASFFAYVYSRPDEFHYCPTPDCPQIYRSAPPDTVLQCPSCLARICPNCHIEAHDGISCANRDLDGEKLFREWMEAHDVKNCPGCKSSIEKIAGCNHMTCSRCQTHICWVCLETFPKAEGIYDHMRTAHGGIGL
jgi:IBR domain, a half RING-finger domain